MSSLKQFRLGIWGTSGAGKTTYLTQLYKTLEGERGWRVEVVGESIGFYKKNISRIRQGHFPDRNPPSETDNGVNIYQYRIYHYDPKLNRKEIEINLDFIDIPGEKFHGHHGMRQFEEVKIKLGGQDKEITLMEYFLGCHGILFLLNHKWERENSSNEKTQYEILEDLFLLMRDKQSAFCRQKKKKNILEPYVAFVVTKADQQEIWQSGLSDLELVQKILGVGATLDWLDSYFHVNLPKLERQHAKNEYQHPSKDNRCQFFSVSSIGLYQNAKNEFVSGVITSTTEDDNPQGKERVSTRPNRHGLRPREVPDSPMSDFDDEETIPRRPGITSNINKIKQGVRLTPWRVIDPIEWFINGLIEYTPSLPTILTSDSDQQNFDE